MLDPHVLAEVLSFPKQNPTISTVSISFLNTIILGSWAFFSPWCKINLPKSSNSKHTCPGTSTEVLDEAFAHGHRHGGRVAKKNKASDTLSPNFEIQTNGHNSRVHWWRWCTQVASTQQYFVGATSSWSRRSRLTLQHSSHGALEL